ncbi:MAG: hypothetical protein GF350_02710 [Chitinivibrionales bacterium]|nr:hypothetical protein [Chitinivibrionales bacterium]
MNKPKYIVCATQRTGSFLLCNLLEHTGVAGMPQMPGGGYEILDPFIGCDVTELDWNSIDLKQFLAGLFESRSGFKLLWKQLVRLILDIQKTKRYKHITEKNIGSYFPEDVHFIYLARKNILEQAASLLAMNLDDIIHSPVIEKERCIPATLINKARLHGYIHSIKNNNHAWKRFFESNNIQPFEVEYEQFTQDLRGTVIALLKHLEIPMPDNLIIKTDIAKQAGNEKKKIIKKYAGTPVVLLNTGLVFVNILETAYKLSFELRRHFPLYGRFLDSAKKKLQVK